MSKKSVAYRDVYTEHTKPFYVHKCKCGSEGFSTREQGKCLKCGQAVTGKLATEVEIKNS